LRKLVANLEKQVRKLKLPIVESWDLKVVQSKI
jgi:hypothetical protein